MKIKKLTVLLIGLLVLSCFCLASAKDVRCPTCRGSGTIDCPECGGTGEISQSTTTECENCTGTGVMTPRVSLRGGLTAEVREGKTYITATFFNKEIIPVDAKVKVTLASYSMVTDVITFPPLEELTQEIPVDYVGSFESSMKLYQALKVQVTELEEITCPYCDGEGTLATTETCPECDGTGTVECPDCDGTGYVDEALATQIRAGKQTAGLDLTLIAGAGAAVAVALGGGFAGFFLLKKRRVNENSLRRLSSGEFQAWVLKRLDGKSPTQMDTSLGIDGFTSLNQPIQIKQADSVNMNAVDLFASSVARKKANGGVIVAFSFADDAIRGKVRARRSLNLDIQMYTVRELIENRKPY